MDTIGIILAAVIASMVLSIIFTYISKILFAIRKQNRIPSDNSYICPDIQKKSADAFKNISNVPYIKNRNFTGREKFLSKLRESIASTERPEKIQAITGLGGVGKTQIALEYIYRYGENYDVIWWIRSGDKISIAGDYANLSLELKLPERNTTDQLVIFNSVKLWLERNKRWLLVFDNAKDPEDIEEFLPKCSGGDIIITSRNPNWGSMANTIPIDVFKRSESLEFIQKRTGQPQDENTKTLAEITGDLPLALEQAGAYIETSGTSLSDYIQFFNSNQSEILDRGKPLLYPDTVAKTWIISFQDISRKCPVSSDLLKLFAFLASDEIPIIILLDGVDYLPESISRTVRDDVKFNDALIVLRSYSFININEDCISIHRLVQAATRANMTDEDQLDWAECAVRLLTGLFPEEIADPQTWPFCLLLLPHASVAAEYAESLGSNIEEIGVLLFRTAIYLRIHAMYNESRTNLERARKIYEKIYGQDSEKVAATLHNLGLICRDLGRLNTAKEYLEYSLRIYENLHGPNHQDVAKVVASIGLVMQNIGDLKSAKDNIERALKIYKEVYGENNTNVADAANNLGLVFRNLGDLTNANINLELAMKIYIDAYGPDALPIASIANNIGDILIKQGDFEGAKRNFEKAKEIDEIFYGRSHPNVAIDLNNLASILQLQDNLSLAKKYYKDALVIDIKCYGRKHPNVAVDLNNLGGILQRLGNLEGARKMVETAINIDMDIYGPKHPYVAKLRDSLGSILEEQKKFKESKEQFEIALQILKAFFDEEHPDIISVEEHLNALKQEMH